jgi:hypothetical protein
VATLIHCPTDIAVLLLALKREDGLILIPTDDGPIPGIVRRVNTTLPINPQLLDIAAERTKIPRIEISIWQEFQDGILMPDGSRATVYAARSLIQPELIPQDARPLPDILRSMLPNRNRVAYMRALQVFSGALEEQTKALDLEEVRRHIQSLDAKSDLPS